VFDAVVIPGGGVRNGGVLPPGVAVRFDRAIEIAGAAFLMPLSAGTPYRPPPLDERGIPITEARAGAAYLMARGVPAERILVEESSYDTLGNAYFSRVIHAIPRGFAKLLVITSAFHMPRVEAVFRWVYALDGPGPRCGVDFDSAPNVGIDPGALAARIEKEGAGLAAFEPLRARMHSLADLHAYVFAEHGVYAAERRIAANVDPATY
jgi:hypothetical protein